MHRIRTTRDPAAARTPARALAVLSAASMAFIAAVGTLTGCGSGGVAGSGTTITDGEPSSIVGCDVTAELNPLLGAASGTTYWDLVVTNKGILCTLPASPRLTLLDHDHKPLPIKIEADPTAQPFPLNAHASAAILIRYGTDGNPPCDAETAYLLISPPGDEIAFRTGSKYCANDTMSTATWTAGKYAVPR